MISLEQVQLLELKVARAIEYVQKVTEENTSLTAEKEGLLVKLDAAQKRLDELESLVMRFKEDQGRIEDGIMAALDRLSQFETAFEKGLKEKPVVSGSVKKPAVKKLTDVSVSDSGKFFEINETIPDVTADKEVSSVSENEQNGENNDGELDIF